MSLDALDLPLTELEQQVLSWVEEALALRHDGSPGLPPGGAAPHVIQDSLLQTVARLSRIEELLQLTVRARGRARRAAKEGKYLADDAWGRAIVNTPRQEYVGAKERDAEASLRSFDQQRLARAAERLQSVTDEAYEVIKLAHEGLSSLRYDHATWLRSFQFQTSLDH